MARPEMMDDCGYGVLFCNPGMKMTFVLTDGDEVYDIRKMDSIDFEKAQQVALEATDGNAWWESAEDQS